ncbi:PQQ-binding-like beta-propeller repeat protein [Clostridium sp. BJN0001]|uniref:outer membrane protein assembly factor BamB family protein n=1 Tax=Clostridium sp. BJN0001 TaxID=2930219 RepID=UPI001FD2C7B7|nr:PQQ-binding-like beta-propeller repeat protein [Clostridium sp. BJN0001]
MLFKSKKFILAASVTLSILVCLSGCGKGKSADASLSKETEVTDVQTNIELIESKELSNVKEDQIPDVTDVKWSFGLENTQPIVSKDGKNVLIVEKEKMTWYDIESKKEVWSNSTYGNVGSYIISDDKLYLADKYSYKNEKKEANIICLDVNTGKELWRYNVQKDLKPVTDKYMKENSKISISGSIKMTGDDGNLYVCASSSWDNDKDKDKAEVLLKIDKDGNKIWQTESHGFPGIMSMSEMTVFDGKIIMGNYSYGDDKTGPAFVGAYDINTGKEAWHFDVKNDSDMAYTKTTNVNVGIIGDKIVAVAGYGRAFVLDKDGNEINHFDLFKPEKHDDINLYTAVSHDNVEFGKNELIVSPNKTYLKDSSDSKGKLPAEHSDVGVIKVFDLDGNLNWKFRTGGTVTNIKTKGDYLVLGTCQNQDNYDYSYCGIYAFDISKDGKGKEIDTDNKDALEGYVGYFNTDGAILYNSVNISGDGKVICATTWPTKVDTEKHGTHNLYTLKLS